MDLDLSEMNCVDNGMIHYEHIILTDVNGLTRQNLLDPLIFVDNLVI